MRSELEPRSDPTRGSFLWYPRAETAVYRLLARAAARALSSVRSVRSVYARRSVASGEVVLGRSDVDLHVIIDRFDDPFEEGKALAAIAKRVHRLRRLLPILGDCDVSTRDELDRWYGRRPGNWYRDRGWLRLWGEPYERPAPIAGEELAPAPLVRWFLIAAQRLPAMVRRGLTHHCANVAADLLHVRYLIRDGGESRDRLRSEILAQWQREEPSDPRRERLAAGYAKAFRGGTADIGALGQRLALELGDAIAADLGLHGDNAAAPTELAARPPFGFEERRYLVIDPGSPQQIEHALSGLSRDPRVVPTTLGTLALQLRFWRPWEWESLTRANASLPLHPPSDEDYLAEVRFSLHREFPRRAGFAPATAVETELRLAQCKLFLEEGRVAASCDDLVNVYASIYGRSPALVSPDDYFATRYPASARLIDELVKHPRLR